MSTKEKMMNEIEELELTNEEAVEETETKSKKKSVNFQDTFDRSFNRVVVKKNPLKTKQELRLAVSNYYDIQDFRISAGNRQSRLNEEGVTSNISFDYTNAGLKETEEAISKWLKDYVENDPIGKWLISIKGIGPVLAAGLLSYIDISKCQTAGAIWKYAGWEGHSSPKKKGEKLNYNPKFRVLCWKCGESFQKLSGFVTDPKTKELKLDAKGNPIPKSMYGRLYAEKLEYYKEKNEQGGFADMAKLVLSEKKFGENETKRIYESGKLPPAHLIAMAKRYAVKIFLSHLFTVWYEYENKKPAPRPFAEVHLGHVHMIEPPNKEILGL